MPENNDPKDEPGQENAAPETAEKAAAETKDNAAPQTSAGAGGGGVLTFQGKPIRPLDPLVREAYREAFGVEAGDVTFGPGMGDFRVSVRAPNGKPVEGYGASREAAFEDLIARLRNLKPHA